MQQSKVCISLIRVFALAAISFFVTSPLRAAEPTSRNLDSGWQFRIVGKSDQAAQADLQQWHPAQVPGVVQTDLLHNHLIPDPFYHDNESRLQSTGDTDFSYHTSFQLD